MATIEDQITAQTAILNQILTAVQGIAKPEDLTPVVTAIAGVQTTANAIAAKLPIDAAVSQ